MVNASSDFSSIASPVTAITLCAFIYPWLSRKGAFIGLSAGLLFLISMTAMRFNNVWIYAVDSSSNGTGLSENYTNTEAYLTMNGSSLISAVSQDLASEAAEGSVVGDFSLLSTDSTFRSDTIYVDSLPTLFLPIAAFMVCFDVTLY